MSIFTVNLEPCPCEPQKFSLKKQLSFTALKKKSVWGGTSLNVQWLRLHAPNPEGPGSIPGQGTRSCVPQLRSGTSQVVFLVAQRVKNLPASAGDTGSIPGLGRAPGEGNGNPLQYSCLENPMDRSLRGSSLWGRKESDTAKQLNNNKIQHSQKQTKKHPVSGLLRPESHPGFLHGVRPSHTVFPRFKRAFLEPQPWQLREPESPLLAETESVRNSGELRFCPRCFRSGATFLIPGRTIPRPSGCLFSSASPAEAGLPTRAGSGTSTHLCFTQMSDTHARSQ